MKKGCTLHYLISNDNLFIFMNFIGMSSKSILEAPFRIRSKEQVYVTFICTLFQKSILLLFIIFYILRKDNYFYFILNINYLFSKFSQDLYIYIN